MAASVALYAVPTVPLGRLVVVIVSAGTIDALAEPDLLVSTTLVAVTVTVLGEGIAAGAV